MIGTDIGEGEVHSEVSGSHQMSEQLIPDANERVEGYATPDVQEEPDLNQFPFKAVFGPFILFQCLFRDSYP